MVAKGAVVSDRNQRWRYGTGAVSYRSGVIEAPRRFDLVGLAGEVRPLELRVRDDGGAWSDWTETEGGDPLYGGGSDQLELRARGWRPTGTLHYVDVRGSAPVAAAKGGPGGPPAMVGRGEWGANRKHGGCKPRTGPVYGSVRAAAVHHTVTANSYSRAEAAGIVLGICRYHRNANGWNDIGYNALVDRFGTLYVGRAGGIGKAVVGAHAQGYNAQSTGVAAIGTHSSTPIAAKAMNAFARFLAWKLDGAGIPARGSIRLTSAGGPVNRYPAGRRVKVHRLFPHRRVDYTECPGKRLLDQLDNMARRTTRMMRGR